MYKDIVTITMLLWSAANSALLLALAIMVIKEWINGKISGKVREEAEEISDVLQDNLKAQEEKTCQAFGKVGKDIGELRRAIMHFHPEAFGRGREASEPAEEADNGQPEAYNRNSVGF